MIHKDKIDNYNGSMEELAEDLGNLKYNALGDFLELLATKIQKDSNKDRSRARVKLAKQLDDCANHLNQSAEAAHEAWRICKPYMK